MDSHRRVECRTATSALGERLAGDSPEILPQTLYTDWNRSPMWKESLITPP